MTAIVAINASKRVNAGQLDLMLGTVALWCRRDVGPAYGLVSPTLLRGTSATDGAIPLYLADAIDDPDALGYHDVEGGVPAIRVACNPVLDAGGGSVLGDPQRPELPSVASVIAHEVVELLADFYAGLWATRPDGTQVAYEPADAVESDQYFIGTCGVTNFVLPAWFNGAAPRATAVDFLKKLPAPFSMDPGGYMITRDASGNTSQVFGSAYPQWRRDMRAHAASRAARRGC